ncbi:MAG: crossover junction endodeoxyribonuclease RuvC, partial [Ignavibacteriaceae bacterium]|nr:crossover junction endodeoxyribonuclease RuvC [Ignavibacteriaceae bacterium]
MRIIGIDPGTIVTGFGVVDYNGNELKYIASGIINIPPKDEMANRLELIYDSIDEKIKLYKPTEFSIETAFFNKNVQSALNIGYARGVSLL